MTSGLVVGAGPNGLAAALTLARAGVEVTVVEAASTIGGGTRTGQLTGDGLLHDHCSAVHPLAVGSPFLRSLDLDRHGVRWCQPEIDLAHPLDDGTAGVMRRSLEATAAGLGPDGVAWQRLFGPLTDHFDDLLDDLMGPLVHVPRHPVTLSRFGVQALQPAALTARRFATPQARALWSGVAAHAFHPLGRPATTAVGLMLIGACHRYGWVVVERGSQSITDAMAKMIDELGGKIETGVRVTTLDVLPVSDVTLLDLSPSGVLEVAGDRLPGRVRRAFGRWRHGPAAFKLDLAVEGGVPWVNPAARQAGTVHLGGTQDEVAAAERDIRSGRMPPRPFVLVAQQYLADPTRSAADLHPVWSYAHVPNGYPGDATEAIIGQIDRFAPGVRDRIVAMHATSIQELAAYNPNYVGGDIATGAYTARQVALRPRAARDPYSCGAPGLYICSAATPPGAGVHGMCGHNAANRALAYLAR